MNELPADGPIHGYVAAGFEPVAEAFARNFTALGDLGAAFVATRGSETLVDLWGGEAAPGRPWSADTLQVIFSGTKALTATCMLMLVDRGQLELDRKVADYWPQFAAGGKGDLTVADIVTHRAGLPGITRASLSPADLTDDAGMEARLAAEPLSTDPRAFACYHALTIGWLCGAILRRIDGRTVGRFFAEEIATPLGLDVWIGLPEPLEPRVGELRLAEGWGEWDFDLSPQEAADPVRRSVWGNPPLFPASGLPWNGRAFHAAEIPGGGAIATARSMSRFYACLANGAELDGVRLMSAETLAAGRVERSRFVDPFLQEEMAFGTMYALQTGQCRFGPPEDAFGHSGAGGSIHAAWPGEGIGISYVMNEMRADPEDRRSRALLAELHAIIA